MNARRCERVTLAAVAGLILLCLAGLAAFLVTSAGGAAGREERRGDRCFQRGDGPAAEACWRRLLDERPDAFSVRNKLAVLYMNGSRFSEAGAVLSDGIRRCPGEVTLRFNLALLRYMERDGDAALRELADVERLCPGQGTMHYLKAVIHEERGEAGLAHAEFVKQLNVDPVTPKAWRGLEGAGPLAAAKPRESLKTSGVAP